jgi:hypothetical protein
MGTICAKYSIPGEGRVLVNQLGQTDSSGSAIDHSYYILCNCCFVNQRHLNVV